MKENITFRTLSADEIEVRPAMVKDGKITLLLYQNARCAMNILDETVGCYGWQKKYDEVKGVVYCSIGIKSPDGEWIWKADAGIESNIDAAKGEASDATKRAAVCWGIGRELYTAPRITIDDDGYGGNGYKVGTITYNENREISYLTLTKFGKVVYEWNSNGTTQPTPMKPVGNTKSNKDILAEFCRAKVDDGEDKTEVKKFFSYYNERMDSWKNTFQPEPLFVRWMATKR